MLLVVCMCFALNTIFYKVTGNVFILENFKNLESIFMRTEDHREGFSWPIFGLFIGIYLLFVLIFFVLNIFFQPEGEKIKRLTYPKLGTILLVSSVTIYSLGLGFTSIVERNRNNSYIDSVSGASIYNAKRIGLLTYYVKNLCQMFFKPNFSEEQLIDYFVDSSYLQDDFTGVLSNYNVITITIETGGEYMLNKYTTPNLYHLLTDGIHCNHNYSKNKTLYSELLGIVGNTPSIPFEDMDIKYRMPFALPNLLNGAGYDTAYFEDIGKHNDVFDQKTLIKNTGYQNCYYHYDLMPYIPEYSYDRDDWQRDSDVFAAIIDKILSEMKDKFYLHYTTMCMHASYEYNQKRASLMDPLIAEFKPSLDNYEANGLWTNPLKNKTPEEEYYYNYTLCTMDFDKGLGLLLDYLTQTNKLDKTLIVLYGDHDCYGVTNPFMSWQIHNKDNKDEIAIYDTILGFYNPTLNNLFHSHFGGHEFNEFTSPMVIVPTILDLLGVKYNPKFYQGKSVFDPSYANEVFYSIELQKFMNENYLSEIGVTVDKTFSDNNTKKEFLANCTKFLKQQKYIDYIYDNNIFKNYDYNRFLPGNNL